MFGTLHYNTHRIATRQNCLPNFISKLCPDTFRLLVKQSFSQTLNWHFKGASGELWDVFKGEQVEDWLLVPWCHTQLTVLGDGTVLGISSGTWGLLIPLLVVQGAFIVSGWKIINIQRTTFSQLLWCQFGCSEKGALGLKLAPWLVIAPRLSVIHMLLCAGQTLPRFEIILK